MVMTQSLDLQHRTLDRELAEVEFFAQKRNFAVAAERFATFRRELEMHLGEEEKSDPVARHPTIRAQHAEVCASLEALGRALREADYARFCTRLDLFVKQLAQHQATEELAHSTP
jgi:heme oxygenase